MFSVLLVTMAAPALFFAFGDSRTQLLVSRLILSSIGASLVGIHMTAVVQAWTSVSPKASTPAGAISVPQRRP